MKKPITLIATIIAALTTCYTQPDQTKIQQTPLEVKHTQPETLLNLKFKNQTRAAQASKTTLPDINMELHTYKIAGKCDEGSTIEKATQEKEIKIKLIPGKWTIAVEAENAEGIQIACGKGEVEIQHHQTTPLEIQLHPYTSHGQAEITVEWEQGLADGPHIEGQLLHANTIPIELEFKADQNQATAQATAPAGYYILQVKMYDKSKPMTTYIGGKMEVVRIMADQETKTKITIISNPGFGYGHLDLDILVDLKLPIEVQIQGAIEKYYESLEVKMTAAVPHELDESQINYDWYLNGIQIKQGKTYTTDKNLPPGKYQLDLAAYNETGDRAGSTSIIFEIEKEPWLHGLWQHRQKTELPEFGITEILTNYPMMIKLTPENFDYTKTKPDGRDIRITMPGSTQELSHYKQTWDPEGQSIIQVKIPELDPDTLYKYIWLYSDNETAQDTQDPHSTWDSNYAGVWHLDELETGPGTIKDKTKNEKHGTPSEKIELGKTGQIAECAGFESTVHETAHIEWQAEDFDYDYENSFTIELWLKQETIIQRTVLSKKNEQKGYKLEINEYGDILWTMQAYTGWWGARQISKYVYTNINDGQWHYIAVTYNGTKTAQGVRIYIDGTEAETYFAVSNIQPGDTMRNSSKFYLGRNWTAWHNYKGDMDEVRISETARSADWLKAQWEVMKGQGEVMKGQGAEL